MCLALQIEHDVLARPMHAHDPLALKRRGDDASRRLERLLSGADPDRFDGVSDDARVEAARNRFNFGEFRHVVRIQDRVEFPVFSFQFSENPQSQIDVTEN